MVYPPFYILPKRDSYIIAFTYEKYYSQAGRAVSGSYGMTGPLSLPGPGANYMNIPPASPRNKASAANAAAAMAADNIDSTYPRYSNDEGYDGPRSLPYSLQQYEFQDSVMYQVNFNY